LDLGKERPLDVGDRLRLRCFNIEVFNNSTLHVNQEWRFEEGLQMMRDLRFLNSLLILITLVHATSL
jgi:hypothetical protein